ncbi:MAG: glycosyltransferase family 9 protein [Heliobacteriaceae bacterium]|nr:glycosyltransferase family 9 protein [Heliobacteriaceae bacterium]
MFKSFYWMAFCAAERRIICRDAREFSRFGANEVIPAIQTGYQRHSVNNYLQFAKHLGLKTDSIKFTLPETPPAVKTKVDGLLNALSSGKPVVVIAPATTWELKHWKPDNWKELVNALKDKYNLIFTGMECDKPLISYIGGDEFINLTGKTNIQDLIEIFSRADLVIAPDSGSCHLARAVCKPAVIAIFTCTPAGLFGPVGEGYFSVSGSLECQPCLTKKCPLKHKRCVNYPQPQEIINIVNNLFKKQVI